MYYHSKGFILQGVQCLAQGHFNMQTGRIRDHTNDFAPYSAIDDKEGDMHMYINMKKGRWLTFEGF